MTDKPDGSGSTDGRLPQLSDVERIRDDLFYGFRSYHTPIGEQRALVEALIAARPEGRERHTDIASCREVRSLFLRLWTNAGDADSYVKADWIRLAELLSTSGIDVMSPPRVSGAT